MKYFGSFVAPTYKQLKRASYKRQPDWNVALMVGARASQRDEKRRRCKGWRVGSSSAYSPVYYSIDGIWLIRWRFRVTLKRLSPSSLVIHHLCHARRCTCSVNTCSATFHNLSRDREWLRSTEANRKRIFSPVSTSSVLCCLLPNRSYLKFSVHYSLLLHLFPRSLSYTLIRVISLCSLSYFCRPSNGVITQHLNETS